MAPGDPEEGRHRAKLHGVLAPPRWDRGRPPAVLAGVGVLRPGAVGRVRHRRSTSWRRHGPRACPSPRPPSAGGHGPCLPAPSARSRTCTRRWTPTWMPSPPTCCRTAQHISTDIDFQPVDEKTMAAAIGRRSRAGRRSATSMPPTSRRSSSSAWRRGEPTWSTSSPWARSRLPFETSSRLYQRTLAFLAETMARHPGIRFQCFLRPAPCQPDPVHHRPRASQPVPGRLLVAQLLPQRHRAGDAREAGHALHRATGRLLLGRLHAGVELCQGGRSSAAC